MAIAYVLGCASASGTEDNGPSSAAGSGGSEEQGGSGGVAAGSGGSSVDTGGGDSTSAAGGPSTGGSKGGSAGSGGSSMSSSDAGDAAPITNASTLRAAGKLIGAAISAGHLNDMSYANVAGTEFDYVTPENEMKWESTEATQNTFRFDGGDQIVKFAESHQMKVKGHTLVWHNQLPGWMQGMTGAAAVRAAMLNHITKVVQHFKGHLIAWDVVNEAIDGANQRADVFSQQIGPTYIAEAFRAAHDADSDALLFYNDYGAEGGGTKADAIYNMVKGLVADGVPISGVGLQMHIGINGYPSPTDLAANIKRYVDLGLK
jgi:endo-1,4-beta-xylanase